MDPSMFDWISAALFNNPASRVSGDSRSVRTKEAKDNALLLRAMRLLREKSVILISVKEKGELTKGFLCFATSIVAITIDRIK